MKALCIQSFGTPDVFQLSEIPKPTIKPGHVLIKVASSSINPVDIRIRRDAIVFAPKLPAVLHGDVAGTVIEVGKDVSLFRKGDIVFGCAGGVKGLPGALAEYMLVDADLIAPAPKSLSLQEVGTLPLVSITAWLALIDRARIQKNQKVLIHAGAGGVGHIAIQLAHAVGAEVFTTVSSDEKATIAKQLGADHIINYKNLSVDDYVKKYTKGKGFDVIFDTVGGENLTRSCAAAAVNGTVVTTNSRAVVELTPFHPKGLTIHVVFMLIPLLSGTGRKHFGIILKKIADLVDQKKLRPLLDKQSFRFSEIVKAHTYFESGKAVGKISLVNDLSI